LVASDYFISEEKGKDGRQEFDRKGRAYPAAHKKHCPYGLPEGSRQTQERLRAEYAVVPA